MLLLKGLSGIEKEDRLHDYKSIYFYETKLIDNIDIVSPTFVLSYSHENLIEKPIDTLLYPPTEFLLRLRPPFGAAILP